MEQKRLHLKVVRVILDRSSSLRCGVCVCLEFSFLELWFFQRFVLIFLDFGFMRKDSVELQMSDQVKDRQRESKEEERMMDREHRIRNF